VTTRYTTETVRIEQLTLSQLIWRRLKRQPRGYIERVYEMNRGLAGIAPFLPVGTVVKLPLDGIEETAAAPTAIRMWD